MEKLYEFWSKEVKSKGYVIGAKITKHDGSVVEIKNDEYFYSRGKILIFEDGTGPTDPMIAIQRYGEWVEIVE